MTHTQTHNATSTVYCYQIIVTICACVVGVCVQLVCGYALIHHHSHGSDQTQMSGALTVHQFWIPCTVIETRTLLCGELTSWFVCIFTVSREYVYLSNHCKLPYNLNIFADFVNLQVIREIFNFKIFRPSFSPIQFGSGSRIMFQQHCL